MIRLMPFRRQYFSHNGNNFPSNPLAHAVHTKGTYENLQALLQKLRCDEHQRDIFADLKFIAILNEFQGGYIKLF